jgi:hypothetical protein
MAQAVIAISLVRPFDVLGVGRNRCVNRTGDR